jgi:hypothetical protein
MLMKNNHTATRKSFLVFGVLSPQTTVEQQPLMAQPILQKQSQQQAALRAWRLRRYES